MDLAHTKNKFSKCCIHDADESPNFVSSVYAGIIFAVWHSQSSVLVLQVMHEDENAFNYILTCKFRIVIVKF